MLLGRGNGGEHRIMKNSTIRTLVATLGAVALVATTVGCAHVKRDELQTELAELRAEYQEADDRLAGDIASVDTRVDGLDQRVAEVDARTARLQTDLQALATEVDATVVRLESAIAFNAPVHFEYDSDELRPQDHAVLERFASVIDGYYADSLLTVEGFTDPAGSAAYNRDLGERRAEAVKGFLVERGVDAMRIRTVSYGEDPERQVNPGAQGPGTAGLPNRRVTLVIETAGPEWDIAAATDSDSDDS